MRVFGTLGFTPEKFLVALRNAEGVDHAVVVHDRHDQSRKAAQKVAQECNRMGVEVETVPVDAFDIVETAEVLVDRLRHYGTQNTVFNVTGGTKVLTAAAVLACILEGVRAVSYHEETHEQIPLPLLTVRYNQLLSKQERVVFEKIAAHNPCTQSELARELGLAKGTVNHHVQNLVKHGLIRQTQDKDDGRRKHLVLQPGARLLLGGDL